MKYYIYENYKDVQLDTKSYCGSIWDAAGIREQYKEYWDDPTIPLQLVKILNASSIKGFCVYGIEKLV